jgi:oligoendopeptidase F
MFKEEDKLEEYRQYLENIYEEKQHKLSDETEQVLASLGEITEAPYKTYSASKAADMQFDSFEDSNGNVLENSFSLFEGKYEFSEDPIIRKNAYASFNKTLTQYKNTYAVTYSTEVKKQVVLSRVRGYESVTDMLLSPQKVTKEMYNRQINVIYKELAPHMHRFAGLLKKELGLDTLNFYDLKAPLDTSYNPSASYEEVQEVILKALAIMGEEYTDIIKTAFADRWVDYADNIGKSTGAFCASPYASHPFILVSFQDNMRDAFTLAHELGHAGHFFLANIEQRYFNTEPSLYTIEAPSTMNEMLLGRYLLQENDDPKIKKWVILQFLGTYYHNFVTHLLEAEFQRRIYTLAEEGMPLTVALLCETKLAVLKGFWGDSVNIDDDAGMTWMRQPHYYMGLYPYTYSAGLTASTAVSEMIFEEGQPAVERWIKMLKTGGKLKPLELLKVAGMDLSSDEPVEKVVAYVGKLVDQLIELS